MKEVSESIQCLSEVITNPDFSSIVIFNAGGCFILMRQFIKMKNGAKTQQLHNLILKRYIEVP